MAPLAQARACSAVIEGHSDRYQAEDCELDIERVQDWDSRELGFAYTQEGDVSVPCVAEVPAPHCRRTQHRHCSQVVLAKRWPDRK